MLDEERREDRADRVQAAEERGADAVKAHVRHGGVRALPLLVAGLVQQRAAERRKAARDGKREHGVAPLSHAAVFGGVLVEAGRLELIAEAGLFQHDPHEDGHEDRQRYRDGDILVAAEELVEPE